jgi:hypothetical protein
MGLWSFQESDLRTISDALYIAEDATVNFYKFSAGEWKRHRYEVKTQTTLSKGGITSDVFALLNKGVARINSFELKTKRYDFYLICLQDHKILKAMTRDTQLGLLPLLVYILTHELVHIVRFCNFSQRFDVPRTKRDREEGIVHDTTFKILGGLSLPKLDYVLDIYQDHRMGAGAFL